MKRFITLIISLTVAFSLFSCSSHTQNNGTDNETGDLEITVTDYAGKKYTLTSSPDKICCISPVAAEIICSLGIPKALAAVDATVAAMPNIPSTSQQITVDTSLPSLLHLLGIEYVVYEDELDGEVAVAFETEGIKTFKVAGTGGIADAYSNIRLISALMFRADKGEELIDKMRDDIQLVKTMADNLTERMTFYAETGTPDKVIALGSNTLISELITIAGGDNIYADRQGEFTPSDSDTVSLNPSVMISFVKGEKFNVSVMRARDGYENTEASKMGRIFVFDGDVAIRPSVSLTDALYEIAYLLDTMSPPLQVSTEAE